MNGLALCAGIGGIELGLRRCVKEYATICYVERDAYAASVLVKNMQTQTLDEAPIWDDVATFDGNKWRGIVDCITAGFPCQPFSLAGKRQGLTDERWIWPDIARIIGEIEPPIVFLENVPGFVSMGLQSVLGDLASLGYDAKWCCITAESCGAPHERERFFLLANTTSDRREPWREGNREEREKWREFNRSSLHEPISHSDSKQMGWIAESWSKCDFWAVEPNVGRVANGIRYRVDRLRCLGNAVVPAQAELAWRILTS